MGFRRRLCEKVHFAKCLCCSTGNQIGFMWRGIVESARDAGGATETATVAAAAAGAGATASFHFLVHGFKVWQKCHFTTIFRQITVILHTHTAYRRWKFRFASLPAARHFVFRVRFFQPRECYQIDKMRFLRHTNIILLSCQIVVISTRQ